MRVVEELSAGGKKARARNPLRVDLAVGDVNPSMLSALTRPRPLRPLTEAERRDPRVPPKEWQEEWGGHGGGLRVAVPQVLVGTADVLYELLVKRELLDTRRLVFITVDEADAVLSSADSLRQLTALIRALRPQSGSSTAQLTVVAGGSSIPAALPNDAALPSPQVTLVTSLVTPAVLRFARSRFSEHRAVVTAASVPSECERRHRMMLSRLEEGPAGQLFIQRMQLAPHVSHHFARMPQSVTLKERGEMLLQLCLAIHSSFIAAHPRVGQPEWIRHESSQLRMGSAAVPPLSPHPAQTTLLVFKDAAHIFPLLSLFSSHFRIAMLSSTSSRSERREALSLHPPPQILLAEARMLRGLDPEGSQPRRELGGRGRRRVLPEGGQVREERAGT